MQFCCLIQIIFSLCFLNFLIDLLDLLTDLLNMLNRFLFILPLDFLTTIDNCITRLRLEIKDYTLIDEHKIKSAGVAGVIRPSKTAVQVIIGTKVQFVADEFKKLCK